MHTRLRLAFLGLMLVIHALVVHAAPGSLSAGFGLGSGILFVDHAGDVYATPVVTTIASRVQIGAPTSLVGEVAVGFVPFVPVDDRFGLSIMAMVEALIGFDRTLLTVTDGGVSVGTLIGAGGYNRTVFGDRAAGTTRRPILSVSPFVALSVLQWEYRLAVRFRILFDVEPVQALEPSLTVMYRIPWFGRADA